MLDIKRIREDYEHVKERVEFRGKGSFGLEKAKELDEKRRALLADVEAKKNKQNTVSREIPKMKKAGEDTSAVMAEMKQLSQEIKEMGMRQGMETLRMDGFKQVLAGVTTAKEVIQYTFG